MPDGSSPGPFAELAEPPSFAYRDLWAALLGQICTTFAPVIKANLKLLEAESIMGFADDQEITDWCLDMMTQTDKGVEICPTICAYSPSIVDNGPSDYTPTQLKGQTGFVFDRASGNSEMSPFSPEMQAFLDAGEPPVYLGWGSMTREKNDELCRAAVGACKFAGKRGIILGGWAGEQDHPLTAHKQQHPCPLAVAVGASPCVLPSPPHTLRHATWWGLHSRRALRRLPCGCIMMRSCTRVSQASSSRCLIRRRTPS